MEKTRNTKFLLEILVGKSLLQGLGVGDRMILKQISEKYV
jgi:hypothetical protein